MTQNFFIGIDGGGSKTRAVCENENGSFSFSSTGGPSNHLSVGTEKAVSNLTELIGTINSKIGRPDHELHIVVGTAGAGRKDDAELLHGKLSERIKFLKIPLAGLRIVSDAEITIEGAFGGEAGIIVIAGTGSIVYGKDKEGRLLRTGGFGKLIGDEGSGFSIGLKGINVISKMLDGRIPESKFSAEFKELFGIKTGTDLINKVYKEKLEPSCVAPLVIELANEDNNCGKIIDDETDELILQIITLLNKSGLNKTELVLTGGLLDNENNFSNSLKEKISKTIKNAEIVQPQNPPEYGALLLAKKLTRK